MKVTCLRVRLDLINPLLACMEGRRPLGAWAGGVRDTQLRMQDDQDPST